MCAEMNTSQVINEDCNVQSRTFDDNRCDSTELGRNLQITAATCTIMAEKLMKKSATKRNRKCISDPCEQSTEEIHHRMLELEEEILALKTENSKLRKIHLNEVKESNQETHSKCITGQEDKKILVLRAENLKLKQLLKDVTEVNKRWQKYNHERQDHLQRLLEAIHEQHKQPVSHLLFNNEVPIKERRHMKLKAGCRHSDSQLEHVGEQSAIQQRYENAVKEICHLKKQLEESRQIQEAIIQQLELTRNEKKDEVLMLELQIKTYKEDWEAEKQERLVALEKINNLNEELNETKVELSNCKERLKQIEETSRGGSTLGKTFWQQLKPSAPSSSGIVNNFEFNLREREIKQYTNFSSAALVADNPSGHRKSLSAPSSWEPVIIDEVNKCSLSDDDKNELECPGCKKTFPKNLHLEFLDHFEECQSTSQIKK